MAATRRRKKRRQLQRSGQKEDSSGVRGLFTCFTPIPAEI
jgi:hypothetical protein